jgi:hypothetical protein
MNEDFGKAVQNNMKEEEDSSATGILMTMTIDNGYTPVRTWVSRKNAIFS